MCTNYFLRIIIVKRLSALLSLHCVTATTGHIVCQNSDKFAHLENRVINSFDSQLASKSVSIFGSDCKVGRQNIDKNSRI